MMHDTIVVSETDVLGDEAIQMRPMRFDSLDEAFGFIRRQADYDMVDSVNDCLAEEMKFTLNWKSGNRIHYRVDVI